MNPPRVPAIGAYCFVRCSQSDGMETVRLSLPMQAEYTSNAPGWVAGRLVVNGTTSGVLVICETSPCEAAAH